MSAATKPEAPSRMMRLLCITTAARENCRGNYDDASPELRQRIQDDSRGKSDAYFQSRPLPSWVSLKLERSNLKEQTSRLTLRRKLSSLQL